MRCLLHKILELKKRNSLLVEACNEWQVIAYDWETKYRDSQDELFRLEQVYQMNREHIRKLESEGT